MPSPTRRNNQLIVDLRGRFINVEISCYGSTHDTKLWYFSEVCLNRLAHFSLGEFILGDPGYIMQDQNIKVPAGEKMCKKDTVKAHVADVHRRHRFVVEYAIGSAKKNFPTAGCPGGACYVKSPDYHGVAWMAACGLTNMMWDEREK